MARKQLQPVKFTGKTARMRDILDWLNEDPNREVRSYDYKSGYKSSPEPTAQAERRSTAMLACGLAIDSHS